MKLIEAVSRRIEKLLDERGWTQYELSKQSGIPRPTINLLVRCVNSSTKIDIVYQIAATMGISLKEFFDDPIFDEVTD